MGFTLWSIQKAFHEPTHLLRTNEENSIAAVEQVEPVEPEAPVPVEPVEPAVPVEPALAPALPADITVTFAYICSGGHTPHTCIAPDATIDQLARAAADLFEGASSLSSIEGLY